MTPTFKSDGCEFCMKSGGEKKRLSRNRNPTLRAVRDTKVDIRRGKKRKFYDKPSNESDSVE